MNNIGRNAMNGPSTSYSLPPSKLLTVMTSGEKEDGRRTDCWNSCQSVEAVPLADASRSHSVRTTDPRFIDQTDSSTCLIPKDSPPLRLQWSNIPARKRSNLSQQFPVTSEREKKLAITRNHARPRIEHQVALCENNYIPFDGRPLAKPGEVRVLVTSASTPSGLQLANSQERDQCPFAISAHSSLACSATTDFANLHFPSYDRSCPGEKMPMPPEEDDEANEEKTEIEFGEEEECWRLMVNEKTHQSANWFPRMRNFTRPSSVGVARGSTEDHRLAVDGFSRSSEPCVVVTGLQPPATRPRTSSAECGTLADVAVMHSQMRKSQDTRRKTSLHQGPRLSFGQDAQLRRQSAVAASHRPYFPDASMGQKHDQTAPSMISLVAMTLQPNQQWNMNTNANCASASVSPGGLSPGLAGGASSTVDLSSDHRGLHNPLYDVSNEFMRVTGYKQEFKRLLSKRTSQPTRQASAPVASSLSPCLSFDNCSKITKDGLGSCHELQEATTLTASAVALGRRQPSSPPLPIGQTKFPPRSDKQLGKQRSAYGRLWKEHPNFKNRLRKRKRLFYQRIKVSDFSLILAVVGILITVIEAELSSCGKIAKTQYLSLLLRGLVSATTAVLLGLIVCYHAIETKIAVIDSGAEDWRVAITHERIWQCAIELVVCCVCPFPSGDLKITYDRINVTDHRTTQPINVPLDAVLSIPMFLRSYLLCRFMALHSRQFQDAATRSIAALNHIAVNFTFVLKTLMHEHPLRVLIVFTATFWVAMAWILTQCERYKAEGEGPENNHYLNSIWFVIITFMSIGYGDIVPNTYCGRALAITTGIVGAGVSSALIAVISRKLELSRAEKHVNQFMTDSKLTRQRKEAAASVLQHTWFIHKYKNIPSEKDDTKLRFHQRRFLASINEFRRVKWDQRKLAEQSNALVDVAILQNDMHDTLWDMQHSQDHLVSQLNVLVQKMQELQDIIVSRNVHSSRLNSRIHSNVGDNDRMPEESIGLPGSALLNPSVATVRDRL